MTQPWKEFKLELYSEQHLEILSQRGIDCSAADLKDLPTTTSTLSLVGLSEDDTEKWVRRLQTCVPKRVTFDMKYSAATKLTDKSKMKELEDGDTKPQLPKLVQQAAGYLLDTAYYDIDRIHSYTTLLFNVLESISAFWVYLSILVLILVRHDLVSTPVILMIFLYVVLSAILYHHFLENHSNTSISFVTIHKTS